MAHKKTLSAETFKIVMDYGRLIADLPLLDLDTDPDDPRFAIYFSHPSLASILAKAAVPEATSLPLCGTHPISIRVPVRTIRAFKAQAAKKGCCYQTLMNRVLCATGDSYL
jgi:hypothetical protein